MTNQQSKVEINLRKLENTCFVVMPFSTFFDNQYQNIIKRAVEEMSVNCIRADEIHSKPRIMDDIWKSIRSARFVIAELSGRNPNVFYEVGLAHAIGKPVIILTNNEEDVPFDLKALRYLFYDTNDPFWGENLKKRLKKMIENITVKEELGGYLDDIVPIGEKRKEPDMKTIEEAPKEPIPKVSGVWKCEWHPNAGVHEGIINVSQKDEELSGTMTVTFRRGDKMTVIQEAFSGAMKGRSVTLTGVSYTYVEKGNSTGYNLDNFDLTLSLDGKKMEGKSWDVDSDGKKRMYDTTFTRADSGATP